MKTSDFSFDLPQELIAQYPVQERGESRLLVVNRVDGGLYDSAVKRITEHIPPGSLLVCNNSRVRKARLYGTSDSGGKTEFLLLSTHDGITWRCMVKKAKKQKTGKRFVFEGGASARISGEEGEFRLLSFDRPIDDTYLDTNGHIPLPPYIKRGDTISDATRYQTVYADPVGSAAAPTAGLHFTQEIISGLEAQGVKLVFVTLHVGLGTFAPVRAEYVEDHRMHTEDYEISESTAKAVGDAKTEGRPVIAIGTTSLRTLESAVDRNGNIRAGKGSTDLFIYPGYKFSVVDGLFTNFHTPDSSLILLVNAFAGKQHITQAYEHAIQERYRFFSYGDAMLIYP
ncbi:MAG: tRNA preQ1(34) S-adenosylmethionine ribosyltransferase-isomerase QueA [Spirochaetales bacterium]|nr:tRNA preQ1(34) S-adenosylmethionine ribosyltransferase-isomerase QueA [Spirochaetales bacterium]